MLRYLVLRVTDQNDHTPVFSHNVYTATVVENTPRGQTFLRVTAVDLDDALNAQLAYVLHDDPDGLLQIDSELGVISSAKDIDFEKWPVVTAKVLAVDSGVPPRSSSAQVILRVINVDDEQLTFSQTQYSFTSAENQPSGTLIGHVNARDLDLEPGEQHVTYSLKVTNDSRTFSVAGDTGAVLTNASLDFELRRQYRLVIFAVEKSRPHFTAQCDVTVTVYDVNDHRPRFTFPSPGGADYVTLDVDGQRPVNQVICTLSAHDDDDDKLTFQLLSDHTADLVHFDLDPVTGQLRLIADQILVCCLLWYTCRLRSGR